RAARDDRIDHPDPLIVGGAAVPVGRQRFGGSRRRRRRWHRAHICMRQTRHRAGRGILQQRRESRATRPQPPAGARSTGSARNVPSSPVERGTPRCHPPHSQRMPRLGPRQGAAGQGAASRDEQALRAAYWADAASILRRRLDLTALLFLLFMGASMLAELPSHPERAHMVGVVYGADLAACLLAMAACRMPRLRRAPRVIGAVLMSVLAALMSGYDAWIGTPAEPLAMAQVSFVTSLVVLLPWGWLCQLVVGCAAIASFTLTVPYLTQSGMVIHCVLVLAAAATTSVCGALFLDRYRYEAFRRSALHREEAEIAAVLLHIGEALTRHLDRPDVLECVNRLTVE